ncbi:MAG: branched-chain amino acid ABC transporter permease [Rhodospirillales bacterium]|nr:branched-chain amino acid ABC transporter permease [Rhodospirillales bacterium]
MDLDFGLLANQIVWGVMVGVSYTLLAMAFSLIFATSNTINFAIGEFAMLAAYVCYTALAKLPLGFVGAALLAMVAIAAFAMALERIAFRRLYNLDPILILIGTIGLSSIIKNLVLIAWGPFSMSFPRYFPVEPLIVGPLLIIPQNVVVVSVGLAAMVGFHLFMTRTRLGTAMRATAQNIRGATLVGINPRFCVNLSWGLGAVMAGIAGVMIAFTYNISIDMGAASGIKGFTAAILGGFGNLPASMAGGVVLGMVENTSAEIFSHEYKDIVAFAVIVLILLFKPSGLFARSNTARRI